MAQALVSIITPTYNCARFIGDTIRSVQAQTYSNWELIIVDDCSTDDTAQVVAQFQQQDSRVQYHVLTENSGPAGARNRAIELAKGEYMAFLDSDDLWMPDKLERQLAFMEQNHYAFTCTAYEQIGEGGDKLERVIPVKPKTDYNGVLLT